MSPSDIRPVTCPGETKQEQNESLCAGEFEAMTADMGEEEDGSRGANAGGAGAGKGGAGWTLDSFH